MRDDDDLYRRDDECFCPGYHHREGCPVLAREQEEDEE